MHSNRGRSPAAEIIVQPGWHVYDRAGCHVGLVDDARVDQSTFSIRQAGFALGVLGDEFLVPRSLVAGTYPDGIALDITAAELDAYRIRR